MIQPEDIKEIYTVFHIFLIKKLLLNIADITLEIQVSHVTI